MSPLELLLWALAVIAVMVALLLVAFVALLVKVFFVPRGRVSRVREVRS
ncbi:MULTISPECIES: hypothetical protein [unclassified Microbacterium]